MSQNRNPNIDTIVYISLPEELVKNIGDFTIDPSILIPVEVLPDQDDWDVDDLTWEMIIAAMLKILVYDPKHEHVQYYREFILAANPSVIEDLSKSGILKAESKDFEIAEEIFKAIVSLNPGDIHNMLNLALVYEEHADVYEIGSRTHLVDEYRDLAFSEYKRILPLAPENEHAQFNIGHFYLKQRNYKKASEHFRTYLSIATDKKKKEMVHDILQEISSKDEMDNLFAEAYDFIRIGKEQEGIEKIKRFLGGNSDVWNAWFLLGWAYRRLARYDEGKVAFERALELGPAHSDTLNELAICFLELKEYQKCRTTLEKALKLEPENVKIISNLGILSLKEDKVDEAKDHFKTVLALDPEDPIALNYMEFLS